VRIGLDFDGTIAAWDGAMARWLRLNGGPAFDPARNITEQIPSEQLSEMVHAILATSLTMEMEPVEGALDAMRRLSDEHVLTVVTARDGDEGTWARRWIEYHGAPVDDVVLTARGSKADACRRLGIDVLLDDTPAVLSELLDAPSVGTVPVLFLGIFWRDAPRPPGLHTVAHWQDFEALCAQLAPPAAKPR
jgi:uncharacterized HAD superfamily protein